MVEVTGFEPMASWSRTKRATNCATPRNKYLIVDICSAYIYAKQLVAPQALPRCERLFLRNLLRTTHSVDSPSANSQLRYTSKNLFYRNCDTSRRLFCSPRYYTKLLIIMQQFLLNLNGN